MRIKLLIITLFTLLFVDVQAQTSNPDSTKNGGNTKFRAITGYGQTYRYGDYIVKSPYHTISAGGHIEIPIKLGLGVETGMKYSFATGDREQIYNHYDTAFFKYSGHWIDIPIRITYTLPIFWGMKIFGYAGPNINIGLSQTSKTTYIPKETDIPNPLEGYPVSGTYSLYGSELRRISFQLGAGGGVQWKNYRLRSGYDWGLSNVGMHKDRPEKIRGWHVTFEYEF
ncbi:MAG: outer membrane beta-barrel protein [Paludibacteraceae bacterium]